MEFSDIDMAHSFHRTFPYSTNNNNHKIELTKQNNSFLTDDGCIHYIDRNTNKIYSWEFMENEWSQNTSLTNEDIECLFGYEYDYEYKEKLTIYEYNSVLHVAYPEQNKE
jgi:hypothetical protein